MHFEVASLLFFIALFVTLRIGTAKSRAGRTMDRQCRSCGAPHPGFAQFCRRCGQKLVD